MKFLISISMFFVFQNTFCQMADTLFPYKNGHIIYEKVIEIDSATKDELYNRAKLVVSNSYKDLKEVLQLDDKANGEIIVKGWFGAYWGKKMNKGPAKIFHTLRIRVKDNKCKIELYNLIYQTNPTELIPLQNYDLEKLIDMNKNTIWENSQEYFYESIDKEAKAVISMIIKGLKNKLLINQDDF